MTSEQQIRYRIDASNRLIWFNPDWERFASENEGEAVMPDRILGRNLFDAIADRRVLGIYAEIINRVRQGTVVEFDYRCDAPAWRRRFSMTVAPLEDGMVEFTSTLCQQEKRSSVALLEPAKARDDRMLKVCSWCQNVEIPPGSWLPVEVAVARLRLLEAETFPRISHGMCEPCYATTLSELGLDSE